MNEERMRILKMIQEGTLSAEEGARLLDALDSPEEQTFRPGEEGETRGKGRFLRIRVSDAVTGREKVNLAVPIGLAKMLSSLVPESQRERIETYGIRFEDLIKNVESGKVGKVVDIDNHDQDEKIEISIE